MAKHVTTILTCAALLITLAACSDDSAAGTGSQTVSTSPAASPSATETQATPTPTPTPTLPKAADGDNLKACADARCEVYVRKGSRVPVKASLAGFGTLVISRVAAGEVDYGGRTSSISLSASRQKTGSVAQLNRLRITTVLVTGQTAILRLTPA